MSENEKDYIFDEDNNRLNNVGDEYFKSNINTGNIGVSNDEYFSQDNLVDKNYSCENGDNSVQIKTKGNKIFIVGAMGFLLLAIIFMGIYIMFDSSTSRNNYVRYNNINIGKNSITLQTPQQTLDIIKKSIGEFDFESMMDCFNITDFEKKQAIKMINEEMDTRFGKSKLELLASKAIIKQIISSAEIEVVSEDYIDDDVKEVEVHIKMAYLGKKVDETKTINFINIDGRWLINGLPDDEMIGIDSF